MVLSSRTIGAVGRAEWVDVEWPDMFAVRVGLLERRKQNRIWVSEWRVATGAIKNQTNLTGYPPNFWSLLLKPSDFQFHFPFSFTPIVAHHHDRRHAQRTSH